MFITLSISVIQLFKPSLLSRLERTKTIIVKMININCKKIANGLGKTKISIKKNNADLNNTLYLNIAKIVNE
tara:strand:+ start:198 stop:413 length:216 start_codon:yes stop_codon:yes gene_type:complete